MFHVILHVHMAHAKDFEAEGTEEILHVVMRDLEVCVHFHEKRGPEIANLKDKRARVGR